MGRQWTPDNPINLRFKTTSRPSGMIKPLGRVLLSMMLFLFFALLARLK
jgi:hypothetical protein